MIRNLFYTLHMSEKTSCVPMYAEIERQTKIPRKLQLLMFRGKMISPYHLACDCDFGEENTIHLSVKGLGGGRGGGEGQSDESQQSDEGVNYSSNNYACTCDPSCYS